MCNLQFIPQKKLCYHPRMDIASLVINYGYLVIFFGTLLEGETWVALGGFAVYQGYLNFPVLVLVAIIGAIIGDQAFFYFGRKKGVSYVAKRPHLKERVERIQVHIEKHQNWLIFSSRFMYGFRAVLPIALGMSRVSEKKFLALNFLGAVVWALLFATGGYLFGGAIEVFLGNIKRFEGYLVFGIILLISVVQLVLWYKRKNGNRDA